MAWCPDPEGRHQYRYWNGVRWTEHVADDGVQSIDEVQSETPRRIHPLIWALIVLGALIGVYLVVLLVVAIAHAYHDWTTWDSMRGALIA